MLTSFFFNSNLIASDFFISPIRYLASCVGRHNFHCDIGHLLSLHNELGAALSRVQRGLSMFSIFHSHYDGYSYLTTGSPVRKTASLHILSMRHCPMMVNAFLNSFLSFFFFVPPFSYVGELKCRRTLTPALFT